MMSASRGEISEYSHVAIAGTEANQPIADNCGPMLLTGDPISAETRISGGLDASACTMGAYS